MRGSDRFLQVTFFVHFDQWSRLAPAFRRPSLARFAPGHHDLESLPPGNRRSTNFTPSLPTRSRSCSGGRPVLRESAGAGPGPGGGRPGTRLSRSFRSAASDQRLSHPPSSRPRRRSPWTRRASHAQEAHSDGLGHAPIPTVCSATSITVRGCRSPRARCHAALAILARTRPADLLAYAQTGGLPHGHHILATKVIPASCSIFSSPCRPAPSSTTIPWLSVRTRLRP